MSEEIHENPFPLAVHPSVLDTLALLPATTKTRVLQSFCVIMVEGILALNPQCLSWNAPDHFTLSITRRPFDPVLENGALLQGFIEEEEGRPRFCIQSLQHVKGRRRIYPRATKHVLSKRDENSAGYVELDFDWAEEQLENPFVRKSLIEDIGSLGHVPISLPELIAARFYGDIEQILISASVQNTFGLRTYDINRHSHLPFERLRFDAAFKDRAGEASLHAFIEKLNRQTDTLSVINFIDEQDPLSLAQAQFLDSALFFAQTQYPATKFQIADVIVRDAQDARPFIEAFRHFHGQHRFYVEDGSRPRAPFTMVLGELAPDLRGNQPWLPASDRRRWFDIDLFDGCRGPGMRSEWANARYRVNLELAIYNIVRAASFMLPGGASLQVQYRDLRGQSREMIEDDLSEMRKSTALLLLSNEPSTPTGRLANRVCCIAQGAGLPFVATIQVDWVEENTIVVPVSNNPDQDHIFPINSDDDETANRIIDAVFDAYDRNPYLSWRQANCFVEEG